ncbi:MAG: OmpH/Skp family outer membrane protein [Rhodospirillaceae bacterium]
MTSSIIRFSRVAAAALILGAASLTPAAAQQRAATVIGVVDADKLLQDSLAAKGVRLEREKYANTYQAQVKDTETKLRTEDQELSQQRGVLAPDVFQQRATAFQQKLADFQGQVKEKQDRLDYSFQQAMQEIGNTIVLISAEVAKAQGLTAVVARNQMVYVDPTLDITAPILERINQRLPSVKFQDPATLQAQAPAGAAPGAAPAAAAKATPAPAKK